jgi:excisionase family DNA binding protein
MSEPPKDLFDAVLDAFREIIRQEIIAVTNNHSEELLEPEQLAERLKVPVSWVYEQSRRGKIPTHRIGRYIRFSFSEVVESQKKQP